MECTRLKTEKEKIVVFVEETNNLKSAIEELDKKVEQSETSLMEDGMLAQLKTEIKFLRTSLIKRRILRLWLLEVQQKREERRKELARKGPENLQSADNSPRGPP